MYTIEDFLNNRKKISIIKDGSPEWVEIAEELKAREIRLFRDSDLDYDPRRSIVYGHMDTDYIQSAALKAVHDVGYQNISPKEFCIAPPVDPNFLNDLL